jgi:hypothetical protein
LDRASFSNDSTLEAAAWAVFQQDFATAPGFRSELIHINRRPHPERLERIPWARPVIKNEGCPQSSVKVWSNRRGSSTHICIWFARINYLVVLKRLRTNYLLKTSYSPQSRRRQQLHREYAAWKKNGARL